MTDYSELSPTDQLLEAVRHALLPSGPLTSTLQRSLIDAKIRRQEIGTVKQGQVYVYDEQIPAHQTLITQLFNEHIASLRQTHPVIVLDVPRLNSQLGRMVNEEDLCFAVVKNSEKLDDSREDAPPYPLVTTGDIDLVSVSEDERIEARYSRRFREIGSQASLAIIYGDSESLGAGLSDLDAFIHGLVESHYGSLNPHRLLMFLSNAQLAEANKSWASPWTTKVNFTQLDALKTHQVVDLVRLFRKTLEPGKNTLRTLVSPNGSGKTTLLKALQSDLERQGIADVAFVSGLRSMPKEEEYKGKRLVFVDEAVNIKTEDLRRIIDLSETGTVVVLMYPHEDAIPASVKDRLQNKDS